MIMLDRCQRQYLLFFLRIISLMLLRASRVLRYCLAQTNDALQSKVDGQNQVDTLNKQKDPSAQDKLVQQDLIETLATLEQIERAQE